MKTYSRLLLLLLSAILAVSPFACNSSAGPPTDGTVAVGGCVFCDNFSNHFKEGSKE